MSPDTPADAIRAALDRVLASETFRTAERSRTLLRFIVEETTAGRGGRLKEYVLGAEALGRGDSFDPRTDPVARVEASRLRSRLDVYYATEGAADALRIALPKGSYVPVFEERPAGAPVTSPPASTESEVSGTRARWRGIPTLGLGVVAIAAVFLFGSAGWFGGRNDSSAAVRTWLNLVTPPTNDSISLALSPDGRSLAYVASVEGRAFLWLHPLDSSEPPELLKGTEDASLPFWAPGGRSIGFFADSRIKRIDLDTRLVRTISTAIVPAGASWNRDDVILHPIVPDSPLMRTTADGAPMAPATAPTAPRGHRGPEFLPDGRHFFLYVAGFPSGSIHVGELGTMATRKLVDADSRAVVAPPDRILYVRQGALFLQRIDLDTVTLAGDSERLAEGIPVDDWSGTAPVSASADRIVFRTGAPAGRRQLTWFDRAGIPLSRIGSPELGVGAQVSLSPNGQSLAIMRTTSGNTDIQLMDARTGTSVPFEHGPGPEVGPQWSPGSDRVVYSAIHNEVFQLFVKPLGGQPRSLLETPEMKQATDWSRDGKYLLYRSVDFSRRDIDLWVLPVEDPDARFPLANEPNAEERDGQFSPSGHLVAYQSNADGRNEIYVKSVRSGSEAKRVSVDGGVQVRWNGDGTELYYLNLQGELQAVSIAEARDGRSFTAEMPVTLFRTSTGPLQNIVQQTYQPSADGTRFLMSVLIEETPAPLRVILNWR